MASALGAGGTPKPADAAGGTSAEGGESPGPTANGGALGSGGQEPVIPDECHLAPVIPTLEVEHFEVMGDQVEVDFEPAYEDAWNWVDGGAEPTSWPYPARAIWPTQISMPVSPTDDVEFYDIDAVSNGDTYVVGRRGSAPLVLHFHENQWSDESRALQAALPEATVGNSVSIQDADRVWLSTPEGLVRTDTLQEFHLVPVPAPVLPLSAVWFNAQGMGVVAGGTVATTRDSGMSWGLEVRGLGFVAPGLAYARSFVTANGYGESMAVVGAHGHLLTREGTNWSASTLFASDVAFSNAGQFITTTNTSTSLLFRERQGDWQVYPVSSDGGVNRVWASAEGDVFAGGALYGVLHRFVDGTLEILPSVVNDLQDFAGNSRHLLALGRTSLWQYDLGEELSSGVDRAAVRGDELLQALPSADSRWGRSAAPSFEQLDCVDAVLPSVGEAVVQGELVPRAPQMRYGSCSGRAEREFSETAFSFTAPVTGTYRFVLESDELQLSLRNGCEGWSIWGDGRASAGTQAVDIGLWADQVLLVEVYATQAHMSPIPFSLSIY